MTIDKSGCDEPTLRLYDDIGQSLSVGDVLTELHEPPAADVQVNVLIANQLSLLVEAHQLLDPCQLRQGSR